MFDNVTPSQQPQPTNSQYGSPPPPPRSFTPPPAPAQPQPNYSQPQYQPQPKAQPQSQPPAYSQPAQKINPGGVEDMFASTDNPYGPPRYGQPHPYARPMARPVRYGGGFSFGKLLIPLLILVVVILLGVAAWLGYNYLYANGSIDSSNLNSNKPAVNTQINANTAVTAPSDFTADEVPAQKVASSVPLVAPPGVPIPIIPSANTNKPNDGYINNPVVGSAGNPVIPSSTPSSTTSSTSNGLNNDNDVDGLTDGEERSLSTDPMNPDTDNDGLTDYAEVRLYHTNPLNPDTDGDGYKDGTEVIGGFDPNKGGGARLPSTTPAKIN